MINTAGIDFGNSNCVVAVPKETGVEVVLNQSSNRLNPTMVTFGDERRYAGELSSHQQLQYPTGTITDLRKLLNLQYDSPERETLSKSMPNLVPLEDGTVGIKVNFRDNEIILRPEQCIALLLKNLSSIAGIENYVITVAPWWSERQRRAMLNACKIANIKCSCLLNTTTAAAIAYILQHRTRLPKPNEKSVNVAFIDIGGSAMNVAIAEVKQQTVQMKAVTSTEKVNGSKLTELFEDYLLEKVKKKYRIDPTTSPRAMLRFRQAVEKAKTILSINPCVQFEVHSLMNVDVMFLVKREEFNEQIADIKDLLEEPIMEALQIANLKKEDIFEFQLLGGTTRVAAIQDELTKIFGKEPKRSMNPDECFAIGSAYMAAYLSPKMRVSIVVKDISPHSLTAKWKDGEYKVFTKFNKLPAVKNFDVPVKNSNVVTLADENGDIAKVVINTGVDYDTKVSLRIRLTQSGTTEVVDGLFEKDGKTAEASVVTYYYGVIKEDQIAQMKELEQEMDENDKAEIKIDEAKNDLEAQIFAIENLKNRNLYDYCDPSEVDNIRKQVDEIQLWFEAGEFDRFSYEEYESRAEELKKIVATVSKRIQSYSSVIDEVNDLKKKSTSLLHSVENSEHQDDPRIEQLMNDLIGFIQKLGDVKETPKYQDIHFDLGKNLAEFNNLQETEKEINSSRSQ